MKSHPHVRRILAIGPGLVPVLLLVSIAGALCACGSNSSAARDAIPGDTADVPGDVSPDAGDPGNAPDAPADVPADVPPTSATYRVMTFNIMCPLCDPWYDTWEQRLPYLGDVFARHDPDLMGIQEPMLADDVTALLAVVPGYAAFYYAGDDTYGADPDATILYRTARFDMLASGWFWLSPTPEEPWSTGFAEGQQVVPRLVTWVRLHDRDAGIDLVFATTHFDSSDPHQQRSAPLVLERLSAMAVATPVIFVGDLNSEPFHPAYGLLTGRSGAPGFHLQDSFALAPAWHVDANATPAPGEDPAGRIDHVMVGGGAWTCSDWRADLYVYGDGAKYPSDHRAVAVDLALAIPAGVLPDGIDDVPEAADLDVPAAPDADVAGVDIQVPDAPIDAPSDACGGDACGAGPCPAGFALVHGGRFDMGSSDGEPGRGADEGPVHGVSITNAFCLQATEVTQGQWKALMGNNPSSYSNCGLTCPVEQVDWFDALAYCNALSAKEGLSPCYGLTGCTGTPGARYTCTGVTTAGAGCAGYRLPTEAEWEYAARAGTTAATYGGPIDASHLACEVPNASLDGVAWACGTVWTSTMPVGSKQPNAWGLYDMLGNTWEWVWDGYGAYGADAATDPAGPATAPWHVFRGGAWDAESRYARAAARYHDIPEAGVNDLGFRPARTVPPYHGSWQLSLKNCWTDPSCKRALVLSHGGDWDADLPYDSHAAFVRAYQKGADGIKTDVLVTKDNVPVVAHSSPILLWESPECAGQKIEEMTADEVTACHLVMSDTETYQRLDDVIDWAEGKLVLMLTVKSDSAFPRAIQAILQHDAADRIFVEVYLGTLQSVIPGVPDHDKVRYNVQISGYDDIGVLLDTVHDPAVMLCETTSATFPDADVAKMSDAIANRLHPAGVKAFIDASDYLTLDAQAALFQEGFDVVMTYSLDDAVLARYQVDQARDVLPP